MSDNGHFESLLDRDAVGWSAVCIVVFPDHTRLVLY